MAQHDQMGFKMEPGKAGEYELVLLFKDEGGEVHHDAVDDGASVSISSPFDIKPIVITG